jgi:DNA-nicking Smr family endonuclease
MASRKKHSNRPMHRSDKREDPSPGFYTPFGGLDQQLTRISKTSRREVPRQNVSPAREPPSDPEKLFQEAMKDVVPLRRKNETRVSPPNPPKSAPRFLAEEEMEVRAHLADLIKGDVPFELTWSDEYVDGAIAGLSPGILKDLRDGSFSYQDYVDLHGFSRDQARKVVTDFVQGSFSEGCRCILIVCGRGLNSADKQPVLKLALVEWLTHAPLKHFVLAFASARSYDGGSGACYVLLRRNKGKTRIVSPAV